jgi:hypothetical protein
VEASLHADDAKEHHDHAGQSAQEDILHCEIA